MAPPAGSDKASIQSAAGNAAIALDSPGHIVTGTYGTQTPGMLANRPAMPYGLLGFNVSGVTPGGIATVNLTLPAGSKPTTYFKQDPATGQLAPFNFDGKTGAIINGNKITLYLQDGGRGDADGVANGTIVDPGGPGGLGGGSGSSLDISQVYASGGEDGATFNRDFIELFNPTTSSIDLSSMSVQYADTASASWNLIALSGTLASGHYYLIGAASNGTAGAALPTVDLSSSVNLAADDGKVALVDGTMSLFGATPTASNVIDEVGYGSADWFEGSGTAPATDPTDAAIRLGNGNYNTGDNQWDFIGNTPNPRNTSSDTANLMPHVTVPATQWTLTDTALTVSGITVTDPDAGTNPLQITLSADSGTLTLASTTGLTFTDGTGSSDTSMTFTGSLTNINGDLVGLAYTPVSGYHGAGGISLWADDQGNTGLADRWSIPAW